MKSLDVSLTDSSGNFRDIIEVYTEIANKVQNVSDAQKIAVSEGLAGKYHITRMQAFLDDLARADSMYRQMYESSVNSAGSATEENERYMDSLQARINLARVEVEKLALSFGSAFMTESLVSGLKIFNDFMSAITNFVDKFGALPALLGLVGGSIYLLSSRFKTFTASAVSGTASLVGFNGTAKMTSTWSNLASVSISKLSVALRGLASATAVGLVFVGVGLALEKMISKMGEAREIQEKIAQENSELVSSYKNNKDTITELSNEYAILESKMKNSDVDVGTQSRYYEVQNELAKLMPSLVSYEDSYGNSILISSSAVESKTKMLESQVLAEEKLLEIQKKREEAEKLAEAKKQVSDEFDITSTGTSKGNMNIALDRFNSQRKSAYDNYNYDKEVKNLQDMEKAIQTLEERKVKFAEEGQKTVVKNLDDQIAKLRETMNEYAYAESEYESYMSYVASATIKNTETIINESTKMSDEAKKVASDMMNDFVAIAGSSELATVIGNTFSNFSMQDVLSTATKEIKKFTSSTEEDFKESKKTFEDYAETLKESILINAKDSKGNTLKSDSSEYKKLEKAIDEYIKKLIIQETKTRNLMDTQGISREEAENQLRVNGDLEDSSYELTESLAKQIEKLKELSSAQEQIVGVSEAQVKAVQDSIFVIQELGNSSQLTAEQESSLSNSISLLIALYPHLTNLLKGNAEQRQKAIAIIESENKANRALIEAYKLAADGKLSAEARATMGHLEETNKRIANINAEILALDELQKKYVETINAASSMSVYEGASDADLLRTEKLSKQAYNKSALKLAELATLSGTQSSYASSLQSSIDAVTDSTKKSTKATKESIYITDKYKQAIEELNTQIAKYQALQDKFPSHSAEYRKYLNEELKLLNKKKTLIEEQTKALEKQIKTGKVAQTGSISEPKYDTTTVSRVSGNTNADKIWNFFKSKGFSDGIVAGIMGNLKMESNLNPSAVNKSSGAYGIAQWLGGRKNGLSSYAKSLGTSMDDLTTQLNYLWKELNSSEKKTLNWIKNNPNASASEMAKMFDKLFERSEGTHIPQRQKYANEFLSAYRGSGSSTSVTSVKTAVSTTQEAIDSAKSQLESLKNELIDISSDIAKVEQEIINSHLESFTVYRDKIEKAIEYDNTRLTTLDSKSKRYNDTILAQVENKKKLVKSYQDEAKYIKQLIDSGSLSAVVLEEMTNRMQELEDAVLKAKIAIQETNFALINNIINNFNDEIDDIEYLIARSQGLAELFEEGSIDQKNEISKQIELMNEELKLIDEKKKAIEQQMRVLDLSTQDVKELEEQLEDLNIQYIQLKGSIKSATKELEDFDKTTKEALEDIADKVIDAYKSAIETQKKIKIDALEEAKEETLDAIDEEIDAENERHDNVMKNLDDELNRYRDIINAKLKQIRRDDSTRTYENELQELQDERAKLQQQLQNLAFNNSFEGLAKRKELNEKIADIDKEIQELQYKRGLELREDNLEDMLELKEDEIEERKELEDEYHNKYTKQLEARKKATEKALDEEIRYYEAYYDELLHDEKTFQELRQAVLDQNFALIESKFNGLIDDLKSAMPDFEFTVNGTWKSVANTLRNTVIKELEDALALIKKFQQEQSKLGTSVKNPLDNFDGSGENGQLTEADMKVILAKFLTDKVAPNESGTRANSIREKAHALAEQGRNEGSKVSSSTGLNDILDNLTSEELQRLGNYFQNNISDANLSTQKYVDYIKNYGKTFNENQTTLSEADMQVLLAKYMKDVLRLKTDNTSLRNAIISTADKIAQKGRNNGSILSSTKGFNEIVSTLSSSQLKSLSNYFSNNSGIISNAELRDELLKYAKQLGTASLDVGGMTPNWSGAGIDGKGGRFAVLHPNEIINNPIDSQNLVKSVSIIDNIMRNIISSIKLPSAPSLSPSTTEIIRDVSIVFQIDKMNGDRNDLDRFSKMINDKLLREKGKR